MKFSATQDETSERCTRNWWFLYPMRMPSKKKGDLDFGTVIHSVCERWLLADETGRVPMACDPIAMAFGRWQDGPLKGQKFGDPVELYPKGWETVTDKKGTRSIPPVSQDLVKKLVSKAIDEGMLSRKPGREIEAPIERELIPGVTMKGKIDVKLPGEIQDHKSTKAMKWARSAKRKLANGSPNPKYLGDNLQMLDYAYELIAEDPDLEVVRLRHNVFCKDPKKPTIRKVDVMVTRAEIAANWNRLKKKAAQLKALTELDLHEDDWQLIPGPHQDDACEAYGGCPFRRICGGVETPKQYRKYTKLQLEQKTPSPAHTWDEVWGNLQEASEPIPGSDSVDIFEKRKAKHPKGKTPKSSATPPRVDGSEVADTAVAEPPQAVVLLEMPPWAQVGCPACRGAGFNKKGSACRICDSQSRKIGGPVSADYVIDADGSGNVSWEAKDGTGGGSAPLADVTAEAKAQERLELPEAPLDQADEPAEAEKVLDVLGAIADENSKATEQAEAEASKKAEAKADEVLPEKPKKPKKPRKPKKAKTTTEEDAKNEEALTVMTTADGQVKSKRNGRPKTGYYLYIDCIPTGVETISAEYLFTEMAADLAAKEEVSSYYNLDVYKRREAFARVMTAEVIEERYNKLHIVARNPVGAPDLRAFIDALLSAASKGRVIQGVR